MADPTYKGSLIARAIRDFIEDNRGVLGVQQVFYGDQQKIPTTPVVCVEPAQTIRELQGIPYQTMNDFTVNILVYHTSIQGIRTIQEECDEVSEALADLVNAESIDVQYAGGSRFGGLILHGHVSRSEYGYRVLQDRLMRCNRLVWTGMTKTRLLEAP